MTNIAHILSEHKKWLSGEGGARADLSDANLSDADLSDANLSDADLRWANLSDANLRWADLSDADLRWANLSGADLSDADLRWANLSGADLRWANLSDAKLSYVYGNGSPDMICLQHHWPVCMTRETLAIGCQQHSVSEWWSFSDEIISGMDLEALSWWSVHKPILRSLWDAKWGDELEVSHD